MSKFSKNRNGGADEPSEKVREGQADASAAAAGEEGGTAEDAAEPQPSNAVTPEVDQPSNPASDQPSEGSEIALASTGAEDEEDYESEDSLTFSNGVIEKIVAIAMRDVPGVLGMKGGWINRVQETFGVNDRRKGVVVEVTPDSAVKVNISVLIEYGAYAPKVFEDVKKTVVKQVTGMTGLRVAGVNLRIEDVLTPEEYAAGRRAEKDEDTAAAATGEQETSEADMPDGPAAPAADDASEEA